MMKQNDLKPKDKGEKKLYDRVTNEINQWPIWKQKAYNETFATSKYAGKIAINKR